MPNDEKRLAELRQRLANITSEQDRIIGRANALEMQAAKTTPTKKELEEAANLARRQNELVSQRGSVEAAISRLERKLMGS